MKSQKLRLGFALCLPLLLVSCVVNKPDLNTTPDNNSTNSSPSESVPEDDRGTISGPGTTQLPSENWTDDPNNPYHKPDIYPSDIADEVTPKDYNLYFYSSVEHEKRDAIGVIECTLFSRLHPVCR